MDTKRGTLADSADAATSRHIAGRHIGPSAGSRRNDVAIRRVVGQPVRFPIDCHLAIRIFVHPHRRLDEMRPQPAWRQLQASAFPFHRVVVADRPILLDAQDLAPRRHTIRHECRTLLLGGDRKPLVVLRNIDVAESAVGRLDRVDPREL